MTEDTHLAHEEPGLYDQAKAMLINRAKRESLPNPFEVLYDNDGVPLLSTPQLDWVPFKYGDNFTDLYLDYIVDDWLPLPHHSFWSNPPAKLLMDIIEEKPPTVINPTIEGVVSSEDGNPYTSMKFQDHWEHCQDISWDFPSFLIFWGLDYKYPDFDIMRPAENPVEVLAFLNELGKQKGIDFSFVAPCHLVWDT